MRNYLKLIQGFIFGALILVISNDLHAARVDVSLPVRVLWGNITPSVTLKLKLWVRENNTDKMQSVEYSVTEDGDNVINLIASTNSPAIGTPVYSAFLEIKGYNVGSSGLLQIFSIAIQLGGTVTSFDDAGNQVDQKPLYPNNGLFTFCCRRGVNVEEWRWTYDCQAITVRN